MEIGNVWIVVFFTVKAVMFAGINLRIFCRNCKLVPSTNTGSITFAGINSMQTFSTFTVHVFI